MRTFYSHTLVYFFSKGISGLLSFLAILFYSHQLSTSDYGRYSIIISIAGIINVVLLQWFRFSISRFYPDYQSKGNGNKILLLIRKMSFVITLIFMGLILIGWSIHQISPDSFKTEWIFILGITLLQFLYDLYSQLFVTKLLPVKFTIVSFAKALVGTSLSFLLVWIGYGFYGVLIGLAIGFTISILISLYDLLKSIQKEPQEEQLLKKMLIYSLPFTATAGLSYLLTYSNRFFIDYFRGASETGLFTLGYDFTDQTLGVLLAIVSTSAFPISMKIYSEEGNSIKLRKHMEHSALLLLLITVPAAAFFIGSYKEIIGILFGKDFQSIHPMLIPCIALGSIIIGIKSYYLDQVFYLKKSTLKQTYILLMVASVNIFLNFVLIPRYGYVVSAFNSLFSFTLATVITYIVAKRMIDIPFPVIDLLKISIAGLVMLGTLWLFPDLKTVLGLIAKSITGLICYLITLYLFYREIFMQIFQRIKERGLKIG